MTQTAPVSQPAPTTDSGDIVTFNNVSISFDSKPVLRNISFRVAPGETRIIMGPAGVGKSVLLKLVDGLLQPDSGRISVFGSTIFARHRSARESSLYQMRANIGMVFQESALFDSLTVRDNVGYRLDEEHVHHEDFATHLAAVDARVEEALSFVELGDTINKFPPELSGGMRRRVAIARAIASQPDLLLYDSPTGGLEPITSTTIIDLIIKQRDAHNTTSLLVTHRLQDAFSLATHRFNSATGLTEPIPPDGHETGLGAGSTGLDPRTKFLVLHDGRVAFDGDTRALIHSTDPWLKEFLS
jgi:phospholipid/cholesterol/gamma-HCH transport system ATP-binding protein